MLIDVLNNLSPGQRYVSPKLPPRSRTGAPGDVTGAGLRRL